MGCLGVRIVTYIAKGVIVVSNISEDQLMEAVNTLKSWCKQHRVLVGECKCPFNDGGVCSISDVDMPCEIRVPCRWTDDDYLLANLLRKKDVRYAERIKCDGDFKYYVRWGVNDGEPDGGWPPDGYFDSLKAGERKYLCDIITEYEKCSNIEEWQSLDLNGNIHDSL